MNYKIPKHCLSVNSVIDAKKYRKNAVRVMRDLKKIDPMILNNFLYSSSISSDDLILARKKVEETLMEKEWCDLLGIGYRDFENDVILPLTVLSLFENARMKQGPGTIEYCIEANKGIQLQERCVTMKKVIPDLARINPTLIQETINLAEGQTIKKAYQLALDICYNKDSIIFGVNPENPEKFEKAAQLYFLFALKREELLSRFNNLEMRVVNKKQ